MRERERELHAPRFSGPFYRKREGRKGGVCVQHKQSFGSKPHKERIECSTLQVHLIEGVKVAY